MNENEKLIENENEPIEKQMKRYETYFDRQDEMIRRSQNVILFKNSMEFFLHQLQELMKYFPECENKHEQIGNAMNEIVEKMKTLEEKAFEKKNKTQFIRRTN